MKSSRPVRWKILAALLFLILATGTVIRQAGSVGDGESSRTDSRAAAAKDAPPRRLALNPAAAATTVPARAPVSVTVPERAEVVAARNEDDRVAALLAAQDLAAPPEEVDFTRDYIVVNGHKAHPRRLLAHFHDERRGEVRAGLLRSHGFRISAEYRLTPGAVALYSTSEALPPADSPVVAAERGEDMLKRIKALMQTGQFYYVEPDYIYSLQATPTDAAFTNGTLWGLRNTGQNGGTSGADIDAVRAWDLTTGSSNVVVAVIDTGVRVTHQDLAANLWVNPGESGNDSQGRDKRTNGVDDDGDGYIDNVHGINAPARSGNPIDDVGHGTHVAGTIGAVGNGGGQHVGVAWQVRLMACKAGTARGIATADARACIDFAVDRGARVLSNSWGGGAFSQALFDSIRAARSRGVLFVASAGNERADNDAGAHYPSNYQLDNIIAVAAFDRQDRLSSFSNYGATTVHVAAPGSEILSTWNGSDTDYRTIQGTSMATPHVSGVAALVLARYPGISLFELRQRIISGAAATPALRGKVTTGGRLNAYNALNVQADGGLDILLAPANGATLIAGRTTAFFVEVTDLAAVTNATVTGTVAGSPAVTFANNGTAPDVAANDHVYSASIPVPATGTTLSLEITAAAPGKTSVTRTYSFAIRQPPPNDNFASRATLGGTPATATGNNEGATGETGEPAHAGTPAARSVWWTWTAPSTGNAIIHTNGSSFDTVLGVYTGSAVNALTRVASDDDSGDGAASRVSFNVTSGATYQIAVDGYGAATGTIALRATVEAPAPAPANDTFAAAAVLSGPAALTTGSNVGATRETGEPSHQGGGVSVWWRWTAPSSGPVAITTDGSTFDTVLAIYTGSAVSSLTLVAADDDSGEGLRSLAQFTATSGTTYHVAVDGFGGAVGNINLAVSLNGAVPVPNNDNFASRATLAGSNPTATGSNNSATKEAGEPEHANNAGGRSVWWTWTAPATGAATITTSGSNFDTLLAVYTGSSVSALTVVASNNQDPSGGNTSRVQFNATADAVYQVAVDGNSTGLATAAGNIRLSITSASSGPGTPAPSGAEFFGTAGTVPNQFFRIDPATGATSGVLTQGLIFGLDFNPSGVLYGSSSSLYTVSPTTGATTLVGPLPDLIVSIAFNASGELYGVSNDGNYLYRLNPATGASLGRVTITGTTFASGGSFPGEVNGIDFAPDGTLYGIGFGIYRINVTTGVATRVTPTGQYAGGLLDLFRDLDLAPDGQLRAVTAISSDTLYAISPASGLGTRVGSTAREVSGIASRGSGTPAPPPPAPPPAIAAQPTAQTGTLGGSATFTVGATGTGVTYQWRRNGANIAGATGATLVLSNLGADHAGRYDVVISNTGGAVTSAAVELVVLNDLGRLVNISVLTSIATAGDNFTLGYVIGGSGTSGSKQLVIRAAGPSLAALGVGGTLGDPRLETFAGSIRTGGNDNWGGTAALSAAMTAVGAFPFSSPASLDAATIANITSRDNSVAVSATGNGTGLVIAEIYDATPGTSFFASTPRLLNVSVLKHLGTGLTAGFVIAGSTPRTVLIRAIGPTLGSAFGVAGAVADPQLTLYRATTRLAGNDNWSGAALAAAFSSAGAFPLPANSRDAALVTTLSPGSYSVEISGVGNSTGIALVEVYEVQ